MKERQPRDFVFDSIKIQYAWVCQVSYAILIVLIIECLLTFYKYWLCINNMCQLWIGTRTKSLALDTWGCQHKLTVSLSKKPKYYLTDAWVKA